MTLHDHSTALIIVDVQARLGEAMPADCYGTLVANAGRLLTAAEAMDLPTIVTEQYPKGLGPTDLRLTLPAPALAKTEFSAWQNPAIRGAIQATGRRSIILLGMETHICVFQTARDLVEAGFAVHVMADGVASRTQANRQVGLDLMRAAGCVISSTETALFDMLKKAEGPVFKQMSRLIR
ncbi:MAG: nicotinamidase-related amidase [Bradymonadia bacterium]|jgi:nicotinamidase-related amidase